MNWRLLTTIGLTALFLTPVLRTFAADGGWVTIVPEETDEILANPGMGWQTFHRTAKQDKSLPSWIPSTVHYARWGWGEAGARSRARSTTNSWTTCCGRRAKRARSWRFE